MKEEVAWSSGFFLFSRHRSSTFEWTRIEAFFSMNISIYFFTDFIISLSSYQGSSTIVQRVFDWNLSIISILDLKEVLHNWISYVQMGFDDGVFSNNLLSMERYAHPHWHPAELNFFIHISRKTIAFAGE